jgi:two-component system cell cycle sensor histidine kinase/response regulator CckA
MPRALPSASASDLRVEQQPGLVKCVIDAIDALVVVALPDGSLWLWNQRCEETSGTPMTDVAGRPIWSALRLRPEAKTAATEAFDRLLSGAERSVRFTAQWLRKDGRKARIAWTARPVEMDGRRFVMATGTESTQSRQAARDMAETEARFEALLDVLPDPVVIHQGGRAVFANRAAAELYGAASPAAMYVDPIIDRVAPEWRANVISRIGQVLSSGGTVPMAEERHLKYDGTPFDVEVVATSVLFDGKPAVELVSRDITARKEGERALQASEARVRAVFDQSTLGMVLVGRDGRALETNTAFQKLFGYTKEEGIGLRVVDITHPADREESGRLLAEMFRGENDGFQIEKRYIAKDGREIWARVHASPIRDESGTPQMAVGTIEDITERNALEEQLRQASKMEALGRLAGGVAHDFNNLLTVVNGYADLLVMSLEGDERGADAVEIRRAGSRAVELTSQLLAFGRRSKRALEPTDLNGRIEAMVPMLRRLLGEDIEFSVSLAPGLGEVEADPSQLDQLVMNLIVNGRDAMSGGGSLTLTTSALEPGTPGLDADLAWARLEVDDTGFGMPPELLEHIFEPFFTTKGQGKGTGLGLATVYGIVQQMGGHVRVESELGKGSRFIVELPLCAATAAKEPIRVVERPAAGPAIATVMLVEDEPTVREFCKRALEAEGYRVMAVGPRDAVEVSAKLGDELEILVTDVVMPDIDGPSIAAALASTRRELKVLFMSGYPHDHEAKLAGAAAGSVLAKPFTPRELCDAVRRVLGRPGSLE